MSGACMCGAVRPSGPLGKHRTSAPLVAADQRARQRTRREARSSQSGRRSRPGQTEGKSKRRRKEPLEAHGRPGTRHAAVAVDAASRPGQGGRSSRFSCRIIRVFVARPSKVAQMKAARCCYMWVLERSESEARPDVRRGGARLNAVFAVGSIRRLGGSGGASPPRTRTPPSVGLSRPQKLRSAAPCPP